MNRAPTVSTHLARWLPGLLLLLFAAWFGFHAAFGERGLLAIERLEARTAARAQVLAQVESGRAALARRVELLQGPAVDADLLEEETRRVLGWSRPGDVVVIVGK